MKNFLNIILYTIAVAHVFHGNSFAQEAFPDFEGRQFYLQAAPTGVGAIDSWKLSGGNGEGVRIFDLEGGANINHRDLNPPFFTFGPQNLLGDNNHGTSVLGEMVAKRDGVGITGIAYGATYGSISNGNVDDPNKANVKILNKVSTQLKAGDVLLLEQEAMCIHVTDDFVEMESDDCPVEYIDRIFTILRKLTSRGVHCIEAAGNGGTNLDEILKRKNGKIRDSGCIMVGAASAPGNPEGIRHRLTFSNYGERVDAFGYGENVVTTGGGELYSSGADVNSKYTDDFGGTSSAAPMVAGVVADLLGIARQHKVILTPLEIREAIRATGTPQAFGEKDSKKRIGNLPDLTALRGYFSKKYSWQ